MEQINQFVTIFVLIAKIAAFGCWLFLVWRWCK